MVNPAPGKTDWLMYIRPVMVLLLDPLFANVASIPMVWPRQKPGPDIVTQLWLALPGIVDVVATMLLNSAYLKDSYAPYAQELAALTA